MFTGVMVFRQSFDPDYLMKGIRPSNLTMGVLGSFFLKLNQQNFNHILLASGNKHHQATT